MEGRASVTRRRWVATARARVRAKAKATNAHLDEALVIYVHGHVGTIVHESRHPCCCRKSACCFGRCCCFASPSPSSSCCCAARVVSFAPAIPFSFPTWPPKKRNAPFSRFFSRESDSESITGHTMTERVDADAEAHITRPAGEPSSTIAMAKRIYTLSYPIFHTHQPAFCSIALYTETPRNTTAAAIWT